MQPQASTTVSMSPDREALSMMTKLKLDRFKQQKMKFEEEHARIVAQQADASISLLDKIEILSKSIEKLFGEEGKDRYLRNFEPFMAVAKANTSTLTNLLENQYESLLKVIVGGKKRSEYNYLFGSIMSQWLSGQNNEMAPLKVTTTKDSLLTNEHLEKIIFERPMLDLEQWREFLQTKLFANLNNDQKWETIFDEFKSATERYSKVLLTEKVTPADVQRAISGLINGGGLDDYRKRLLTKLKLDENAVNEFASSLTLLISDLSDWRWTTEGVRGIFRRNLAGKYRCFYEEDFLTAIFLEHIGLKWSYHFKAELKELFLLLTKKARTRCSSNSIQHYRLTMQQKDYWMASLPDEHDGESGVAAYEQNSSLDLKTKLFYLVNVEIQLHQVVRPNLPFNVVTTDLEWFGPSISHEIIQIFLQACGISQIWLDFFDRFLKQPVYYKPGDAPRQRQRGVPISHSLSYLFSELLIFGMDLYVYRNTGIFNYRLHDDFWFFHHDTPKIDQAWTLMTEYAQMTGLKFNAEKCGSVQIQPANADNQAVQVLKSSVLPSKEVKWGFLNLQPSGRFTVNRDALVPYLDEMKDRLAKAPTVLEWVEIYDQYISFFMRNFGKCANILGTYHTEQMWETFQVLHKHVFSETDGNAITVLAKRIEDNFSTSSIGQLCEGWFYWPLIQGGLGLKNIYLTLYGYHQQLLLTNLETFSQLPEKDVELYADLVEKYKAAKRSRDYKGLLEYLHEDETLITLDEYTQIRETCHSHWTNVYQQMLQVTLTRRPPFDQQEEFNRALRGMLGTPSTGRSRRKGPDDNYVMWLLSYYGKQIQTTFNQLDFIDSASLPIGLITLMKSTKINWNTESEN
ncbi:unnamed protein product [Adineta ricciae]|uniref:Reverse transcriptase domain-containing protein n=2 Tax=Adineta ricciae TaxID=249248 RepID=A0A814UKH8_ADIRI|nr:unnamed protein product [Adineta ricciae]CAF1173456.1 unnamed protein product [Adineta ricciae]